MYIIIIIIIIIGHNFSDCSPADLSDPTVQKSEARMTASIHTFVLS